MSSDPHLGNLPYRAKVGPRIRALNEDIANRHVARSLTRDVTRRLAGWHAQIARLRGIVEYQQLRPVDEAVAVELETLASQISEQRTTFIQTIATLPPVIASSGWITDVDRVLCRASEVVEGLKAARGGRPQ